MKQTDNPPLTTAQLQELDGEPVWVVFSRKDIPPCWMLVNAEEQVLLDSCGDYVSTASRRKRWKAYRRKWEEGA